MRVERKHVYENCVIKLEQKAIPNEWETNTVLLIYKKIQIGGITIEQYAFHQQHLKHIQELKEQNLNKQKKINQETISFQTKQAKEQQYIYNKKTYKKKIERDKYKLYLAFIDFLTCQKQLLTC